MDRKEIFDKLTVIFREVMDNKTIELHEATTSDDIEEWDSLTHVLLVEAIQENFDIKISAKEFVTWANVGEMVTALLSKIQ